MNYVAFLIVMHINILITMHINIMHYAWTLAFMYYV